VEGGVTGEGERQLREALRRWRGAKPAGGMGREDASPGCVYGLMTRDAVEDLASDVADVKAELAWMRRVIVAAVVSAAVGTVLRMAGW